MVCLFIFFVYGKIFSEVVETFPYFYVKGLKALSLMYACYFLKPYFPLVSLTFRLLGFPLLLSLFLFLPFAKLASSPLQYSLEFLKTEHWDPSALCAVISSRSVALCQSGCSQETEATPVFKKGKYSTKNCHLVKRLTMKRSERGL